MFNHVVGCLTLGIVSLFFLRVMQTGYNFVSTAFIVSQYINFYLATLSNYYTGQLVLPHLNGASDGSLAIVSISFILGIVGNNFLTEKLIDLTFLNWSGVDELTIGQLVTVLLTLYNSIFAAF